MPDPHKYTLIQHTGYSIGGNPQFMAAVECAWVSGSVLLRKIQEKGGVIFDSYHAASTAEMTANYTPDNKSIIPRVRGTFSSLRFDGTVYRLYIPTSDDLEAFADFTKETTHASVL